MNFKTSINTFTESRKKKHLWGIFLAVIVYLFSTSVVFYNWQTMPKAGFEVDDGIYAVGATILNQNGRDNNSEKMVPYFPFPQTKYHEKTVYSVSLRATPAYFLAFLEFFHPPGFKCLKLENALFTFLTSLLIFSSYLIISNSIIPSILCASLFNLMPWPHFMANLHPEGSAYIFGSGSFLLGLLYFLKNNNYKGFIFFILSLAMFFFSWAPAFMVAPLSLLFLPVLIFAFNRDKKIQCLKIFLFGMAFLAFLYFGFHNEPGFKWNLGRPGSLGCLQGLSPFNFDLVTQGLKENWQDYLKNYLGYFSSEFLFHSGDANLRHNSGYAGQLHSSLAFSFYLGLIFIFFKKIDYRWKLILAYLLLIAIPYSICKEGYGNPKLGLPLHAMRQCAMVVPITIIITYGLSRIAKFSKTYFFIYLIAISVNVGMFYNHYFNVYPYILSNVWFNSPGLQEVSKKGYLVARANPGKRVFYNTPPSSFAYHNLDKIPAKDLFYGNGVLYDVYDVNDHSAPVSSDGDVFVVQEKFNYLSLRSKVNFIKRTKSKYVKNLPFDASVFELIKEEEIN